MNEGNAENKTKFKKIKAIERLLSSNKKLCASYILIRKPGVTVISYILN
jgi:hypothetical protein